MKFFKSVGLILALQAGFLLPALAQKSNGNHPEFWLTTHDGAVTFTRQKDAPIFTTIKNDYPTITIDAAKTYQQMDGFGYCLTGGSAVLIHQMSAPARAALLKELFGTKDNDIGVSFLRISIGASDLDDHVFSYDDLPEGETDPKLEKFNLAQDEQALIPVLKEILSVNPKIKILGSPWSAPKWMKTNNDTKGGSLKAEFQDAYARYIAKYIHSMKAHGINIDAITPQNEPLNPGNNPSMYMTAEQQADFIKTNLGPAFKAAGVKTKIWVYDHNLDHIDYPLTILKDPEAAKYVDGSAFHLYAGGIDEMSKVHDAYPDKNLYFTEQWVGSRPGTLPANLSWHVKNLIIGAPRNWARTVLEWNLAADPNQNPHTDRGGCNQCLGAVTVDGDKIGRNPAYYIIAHAAKFVRPGSIRVESNTPGNLFNVAFHNPQGQTVLIVLNDGSSDQTFNVTEKGKTFTSTLGSGSVATYVW